MEYVTTALEDWITKKYIRNKILTPAEINLEKIARIERIFINRKPMPARYDIYGKYQAIVVDSRCTPEEQREQFFHELCHILRHVGHQSMLPKAFRQLQEWDANRFTMYAALPYFMVKKYDFNNPRLIEDLAQDFKVTEELCIKRMEQIKRKIMSYSYIVEKRYRVYN
ncbi:ImmA/IrrE family metallo-endopeptidase [Ornithinibacillus bavariensis]|uniref:ImmA/IrrE family metallo-endopeptidase n=1 Tax=Ornithinibacillus bavariensis TaxID=545502 RepID=UPI000EBC04D0|nr:peptidase [Ornithinibacillus sp.]